MSRYPYGDTRFPFLYVTLWNTHSLMMAVMKLACLLSEIWDTRGVSRNVVIT